MCIWAIAVMPKFLFLLQVMKIDYHGLILLLLFRFVVLFVDFVDYERIVFFLDNEV